MGFYFGSPRHRPLAEDAGVVVTPREFTEIVAGAVCSVVGSAATDTYRPRVADRAGAADTLEKLTARVGRYPGDATGHRMLGIAHLNVGNCKTALRHLEIAGRILLNHSSARAPLHSTVRARLELALLVPILAPLYFRLGNSRTVRRLLTEVLLAR